LLFFHQKEELFTPGELGVVRGMTQIATDQLFSWKETELLKGHKDNAKEEALIAQELHSSFIVEVVNSFVDTERSYMVISYLFKKILEDLLDEFGKSNKQIGKVYFIFFYYYFMCFFLICRMLVR
jgi:hypothetical protein